MEVPSSPEGQAFAFYVYAICNCDRFWYWSIEVKLRHDVAQQHLNQDEKQNML